MTQKLTDKLLKNLRAREARYAIGDTVVRGLQVRVTSTGVKSFAAQYRHGSRIRRYTGVVPKSVES